MGEMMYHHEQALAEEWIFGCNDIVDEMYHSGPVRVTDKPDGTRVTSIDQAVSDYVVGQADRQGKPVLSEEKGSTARHGQNGIFVVEPVDGTDDLIAGQTRPRRGSVAAPSIGYWDEKPVVGVVGFPLLGRGIPPVVYSASEGSGAIRKHRGRVDILKIDNKPTKGVVFITVKQKDSAARLAARLRARGYTPLSMDGAVYKACALADPFLLRYCEPYLKLDVQLPVVGFVSTGVHLHDVAATTCIVREAGGVVTSPVNRSGKQLWAAANNKSVYIDLMQAAQA